MKIAIIDTLGLTYNGDTLKYKGLGGSESAVILISTELTSLGHSVTVYNNCDKPGIYSGVEYKATPDNIIYDIVISSRSVLPFFSNNPFSIIANSAKHKILWMHDTFCQGDEHLENMLVQGYIDEVFTLSDFHSNYFCNADHGFKRMFETLKHKFWQTRNGAVRHRTVDISLKNRASFVYNASATKGLIPLVTKVWPIIKGSIPAATLTCIGGYYNMRDGSLDEQGKTVSALMKDSKLRNLDIKFTGIIPQSQIADILSDAGFMLYPTAFPETFGISSLEGLLCRTPIITNSFGALEETAIDLACYKIPYPTSPNSLYPRIDEDAQASKIAETAIRAYLDPYLWQQKANYCAVIDDICSWGDIALQWDQHFSTIFKQYYPVDKYRRVSSINDKVSHIFNRRFNNIEDRRIYRSYGKQQRIVIVSPFYNAQQYIVDNIKSVCTQDYSNYVHILIDDASTDSSYTVARTFIDSLPDNLKSRIILLQNDKNIGAIHNQLNAIRTFCGKKDIVMLLDGDDALVPNNSIFHFYNDLYSRGYDFSYGSMYSLADNIPLIAQDYPETVRDYRSYRFNWGIPYTHLRTFLSSLALDLDEDIFKVNGSWMMAGADNPLFYELLDRASKPIAVKEIMVLYNDKNPLNDYKVRPDEQNYNANIRYT